MSFFHQNDFTVAPQKVLTPDPQAGTFQGRTARQQAIDALEAFGMPALAYLGVSKDSIERVSMRQEAHWKCPHQKYVSANIDFRETRKRRVISVDVDDRWEDDCWTTITNLIHDGDIPTPAFAQTRLITKNGVTRKARAHLIYPLEFPIDEGNPRQKYFAEAVLDAFYDILESHGVPVDRSQGVTFKNPAASDWDVTYFGEETHSLKDWAELFGISDLTKEEQKAANKARRARKKARRKAAQVGVYGERNVDVFDVARHYCYAEKHQHTNYLSFYEAVRVIVTNVHDNMGYAIGLSSRELAQIVKSIAKWTWNKYEGDAYCIKDRGACSTLLSDGMDTQDRQRVGAGYAHDKRAEAIIQKLQAGLKELKATGQKITVRALAAASDVSTSSVQKYKKVAEGNAAYVSKAKEYAQQITDRIDRIARNTAENAPFRDLYCDGVSEYPTGGLPIIRAAKESSNVQESGKLTLRKVRTGAPQRRPKAEQPGEIRPSVNWDLRPVTVKVEDLLEPSTATSFVAAGLLSEVEIQDFKHMYFGKKSDFYRNPEYPDWLYCQNGVRAHKSMLCFTPKAIETEELEDAAFWIRAKRGGSSITWDKHGVKFF